MSNSGGNNSNSQTKASKLGRKGDPRMHRAVSARLANPEISLFDALLIGGFDYPTNDDASCMDSEKVTLGQRKNQLSRRLRHAKKTHKAGGKVSLDGGDSNGNDVGGSTGSGGGRSVSSDTSNVHTGQSAGRSSSPPAPETDPAHAGLSNEQIGAMNAQKLMRDQLQQHQQNLREQHLKHKQAFAKQALKDGNILGARALQMKNDHPDLVGLSDLDQDLDTNMEMATENTAKRQRIAKFHPDYAPLFVAPPSRNSTQKGGGGANASSTSTSQASFLNQQHGHNHLAAPGGNVGAGGGGFGGSHLGITGAGGGASSFAPSLFTQQISNAFATQQAHQPRASSVAVSSLTASAQSIGLTLEQLAMALASNPTKLSKLVTDSDSDGDTAGESMTKKQELALRLYETESRSMYSKCMLMAGIDPRLCQHTSATYLQFALKAWQAEGKRLHDMMGNVRNSASLGPLEPPLNATTTTTTTPTTGAAPRKPSIASDDSSVDSNEHDHSHNHHNHSHSHSHDHHSTKRGEDGGRCKAQHIHRLDGQCGHKAIIHQPKNGTAHIDFVVGNKVECYHGIEPIGKNFDSVWPSKYKCSDYDENCSSCCNKDKTACDLLDKMSFHSVEPKIIQLSDINLQDPEWNYDVSGSIDGGVMGLFKLVGDDAGE